MAAMTGTRALPPTPPPPPEPTDTGTILTGGGITYDEQGRPLSGGGGYNKPGGTGYEQRRTNALEYWLNKSSSEDIKDVTKAPGTPEGDKPPLSEGQQRTRQSILGETRDIAPARGRDEPLFEQLLRQRNEADLRKRAGIAKKQGI